MYTVQVSSGSGAQAKYWHKGTTSGTVIGGGNLASLRVKVWSYDYNDLGSCHRRNNDSGVVSNVPSVFVETSKEKTTNGGCDGFNHAYCGYSRHWWVSVNEKTINGPCGDGTPEN